MTTLADMIRHMFEPGETVAVVGKALTDDPYTTTAEELATALDNREKPVETEDFEADGDSIMHRPTGQPAVVPSHAG